MLSAFKNFSVTFIISAVIFAVIAYFAVGLVTNTVGDMLDDENSELNSIIQTEETETSGDNAVQTPGSTYEKVPQGDTFNFLVAVTDFRPDLYEDYQPDVEFMYDADEYNSQWYGVAPTETIGCLSEDYREVSLSALVLVRIDKENRQFVYTYISPLTMVYTSTGTHTLSEVYELYGINRIAEHVHAMTGLNAKYTAVIEGYNLDNMAELLGNVKINLPKDIYNDGIYGTFQYESTVNHIEPDGGNWVEHVPNTYIAGQGEAELNPDNIYDILTVKEHSDDDLSAKQAYIIETLQKYITVIAGMDKAQQKTIISQLITLSDEWKNIDGAKIPETETETETEPETQSWDDWNSWNEEEGEGESEPEETEEECKKWLREPYEPQTPILNTDFTMNDFDKVIEMLSAVTYFENVTKTYPMTYTPAGEENDEYFDADISAGLELFMEYRNVSE